MAVEVLDETEPAALSFDTVDDARNYASAIAEEFNRRAVEAKFPDIIELYRSRQLYILIPLRLIGHDSIELVFGYPRCLVGRRSDAHPAACIRFDGRTARQRR